MNRLLKIKPISFLILFVIMNASFGNSFMQIKLGPVTLNEFALLVFFLLYHKDIINKIKSSLLTRILFIWFVYSLCLLVVGVINFGPIALRDATHQVDVVTFFIVVSVAHKFLNQSRVINMVFISLIFELVDRIFLGKVFSGFTPFSGQPFFGGSIGSNLIVISAFWIGVIVKDISSFYRFLLMIISCFLILLMQNRYMYVSLLITALLYLFYYTQGFKEKLSFLFFGIIILLSIEPIFTFISFTGVDLGAITKYGDGFSASGLIEHLKTAFGYSSNVYKGADDGFVIRFIWWGDIISLALNNLEIMFGGQGFGVPLTTGTHLKPVREPHNSVISIFARGGIIYLLVWLGVLGTKMKFAFKYCTNQLDIALLFGLLSTLIMSLVEPAFELPPVCILFYFFLGYLLRKKDVHTNIA